jgi:hypothetical protein
MATPPKGHADYLALGDWNAICSVCGRKYKASEMVKLPEGIGGPWGGGTYVCKRDWRPRQPQDFVRGIPDKMAPPWTQAPTDSYALEVIHPEADADGAAEVDIDVCGSYSGAAPVIVIDADQTISVLTINLGTGPAVNVTLNVFGHVGIIQTSTSADACLPSGVTITGGIASSAAQGALNFAVEPSNVTAFFAITPAVEVEVLNSSGNRNTTFTGNVTIALGENPGGATLGGTLTVAAVAGLATFDDLTLDVADTGYTLTAAVSSTVPALAAESNAFDVTAPVLQQTLVYTAGTAFDFDNPTQAISFYNGVVWVLEDSGRTLDLFNLASQSTPVAQHTGTPLNSVFKGAIYQEVQAPGYGFSVGPNTGTGYRADLDGPTEDISLTIADGRSMVNAVMEDSVESIFAPTNVGGLSGQPLMKWSNLNWGAGTATCDTDFGSLGAANYFRKCVYNGGVVDSRVYLLAGVNSGGSLAAPYSICWVHSGTGVKTALASFANEVAAAILAGSFGGGPDTLLYNMSGNAGEANIVQKRNLDGTLQDTCTLTGASTTDFAQFTGMAYDSVNNHLWVQAQNTAGRPTYVIDCATMTLITSGTVVNTAELVQPIGHPSGGAIAIEVSGTRLYRLHIN